MEDLIKLQYQLTRERVDSALEMKMLISMARFEFNTVAAIIAPCSVKAFGR